MRRRNRIPPRWGSKAWCRNTCAACEAAPFSSSAARRSCGCTAQQTCVRWCSPASTSNSSAGRRSVRRQSGGTDRKNRGRHARYSARPTSIFSCTAASSCRESCAALRRCVWRCCRAGACPQGRKRRSGSAEKQTQSRRRGRCIHLSRREYPSPRTSRNPYIRSAQVSCSCVLHKTVRIFKNS